MEANPVLAISLAVFAVALLLFGVLLASRAIAQTRSGRTLSRALGARARLRARRPSRRRRLRRVAAAAAVAAGAGAGSGAATNGGKAGGMRLAAHAAQGGQGAQGRHAGQTAQGEGDGRAAHRLRQVFDRMADLGLHWFDTRVGRQLVAAEDRLLIEQCGFVDARARGLFLTARLVCGIGAPLAASVMFGTTSAGGATHFWILLFCALGLGYMAPKWCSAGLPRIAGKR